MTKRQIVAEDLQRRIGSGEFQVGDKLPGVLELARHYGCSMEVARQALWILHSEGLLRKPQQGLYTRVIAAPKLEAGPSPRELLVELQEAVRGLGAKLEVLDAALAKAG